MNFLPVRVSTLVANVPFDFDIYIKLPHKYLLYVKDGDDIDADRLQSLKKKKVRKLFIEDANEQLYQGFLDRVLDAVANDPDASSKDKANVVVGSAETASEEIFTRPETSEAYNVAKRASSGLIKVLAGNDEVLRAILNRESEASASDLDRLHAHGVNTSSLAIKFGEFMGLKPAELEDLGVAALYHDVGFLKMSPETKRFFFTKLKEVPPLKLTEYKDHPKVGAELLQDKEFATKNVLDLILTHEEKISGEGFPQKLTKLSPIQEIHSLCCFYDRRITCLGENPSEVIEDIMVTEMGNYNLDTLKQFKKFLKKLVN